MYTMAEHFSTRPQRHVFVTTFFHYLRYARDPAAQLPVTVSASASMPNMRRHFQEAPRRGRHPGSSAVPTRATLAAV